MRKCAILLALVNLLTMAELPAQQWQLEGYAGRIRSTLDPAAAGTESVMLGVRYDHPLTALAISAGLPTSSDAPLWGALGASQRLAVRTGGLIAGIDLAGHGFLLHDRAERAAAAREIPGLFGRRPLEPIQELSGHAIAGQLMPVIGFELPSLQAHARAGAAHYIAEFGDQKHTRTVTLADAQLTVMPSTKFALVPAVRHLRADEGDYTYAGVTGILALGAFEHLGQRGPVVQPGQRAGLGGRRVDQGARPCRAERCRTSRSRRSALSQSRADIVERGCSYPAQPRVNAGGTGTGCLQRRPRGHSSQKASGQ